MDLIKNPKCEEKLVSAQNDIEQGIKVMVVPLEFLTGTYLLNCYMKVHLLEGNFNMT